MIDQEKIKKYSPAELWETHAAEQRCLVCNGLHVFIFRVTDEIWNQIVPDSMKKSHICLPCFDHLASAKGIHYAQSLNTEFCFVGQMATIELELNSVAVPTIC